MWSKKVVSIQNLSLAGCITCGRKKPNCKSHHPLFGIWSNMLSVNYIKLNGTRKLRDNNSIPVYDNWLLNFFDFVKDMGDRPSPKHCLGRIDKNKGYTPENCKWNTRIECARNNKHFYELTASNLSKQIGLSRERIRQITNNALMNKENELNKLIERVDYIKASKRVVYKPEAIEYFILGKYKITNRINKVGVQVKQLYLQGKDMETVAGLVNKPIDSIKRYYKIFDAETFENNPATS